MIHIKNSGYSLRAQKNYILAVKHFCPVCKGELRASMICASHTIGQARREEIFAKLHCDKCKKIFSVQSIRNHERALKRKKIEY